ncbi:poly [ADP-ribose] polymerase 1-like [Bidens hawaiensis]|uniref:poly [ADP-ribose] polymerase 1-like n=1 Tax=Bidens hawaiensis TaxID=980011 RepID=UPI004049A4BD
MLLSEVALGDMYELKKAKYIDKPPKGKHSTKGLGKNIPNASEHLNWKDDVIVQPVPSNVKTTELMYNEYIVYNTDQVKLQFLLKVRFHHKR